MLEDFADHTTISATDNQNLFRVRVACKWDMRNHFLVAVDLNCIDPEKHSTFPLTKIHRAPCTESHHPKPERFRRSRSQTRERLGTDSSRRVGSF